MLWVFQNDVHHRHDVADINHSVCVHVSSLEVEAISRLFQDFVRDSHHVSYVYHTVAVGITDDEQAASLQFQTVPQDTAIAADAR